MNTIILLLFIAVSALEGSNYNNPISEIDKKRKLMNSTEKNKEVVRIIYEVCLNQRKYDQLKNYIDPEYTGPLGEKGPAGFEETIKGIVTGFPDIQWRIEDVIGEGNKIAIRWSWEGTHTGTFRVFGPTGKKFTNKATVIYEFRGDKIVRVWMESDRLGFFQQLGVVPENIGAPPRK